MSELPLPRHVAIIMDGNGRWAKQHKIKVALGHRKGVETLRAIIRESSDLGIEALSRGAADCVFADQASAAIAVIRENLRTVGFEKRAEVLQGEALGILRRFPEDRFGLIFLDPPYEGGLMEAALERIRRGKLLQPGGLIVCESLKEETPGEGGFEVLRDYVYGKSRIRLLTRRDELHAGEEK